MPTIKLQVRRDTSAQWTAIDPVLLPGEIGFELDTGKVKIGRNTSQTWSNIPYINTTLSSHTHTLSDLAVAGSRDSTTYLRGDGQWSVVSGSTGITYVQVNLGDVTDDVTIDAYAGDIFTLTMTGNINLSINNLPANPPYICVVRIQQGGTGNNTITWNSIFKHPSNTTPTISTNVGEAEWFMFHYVFENRVEVFKADGPYL